MDKKIKRYDFIDSSKGIGILLVILGHLISLSSPLELSIYSFHMPFFFIVSGLFARVDGISFIDYVKKKT
ncbi:MAG: acyltransferase family protein [Eubacterium sp.]|nr:acyltransferase family protein [Eubacterium sp.]